MKFVVWGAGLRGQRILPHIREYVIAFIDSDETKIGTTIDNIPIISYDEYKEKYINYYIIISYSREDEIIELLEKNNNSRYLRMSDCPGEFQEAYPRNILKNYIKNYVQKYKRYIIYGFNLYALILSKWIESAVSQKTPILFKYDIRPDKKDQIKKDFPEFTFIDSVNQMGKYDELLITVEKDIPYIKNTLDPVAHLFTNIYDCTDRITEYHNPRIKKFKNCHEGKRCFIVATGPSLRMSDLDVLHKNKEICFSMNRIYYAFKETDWRPDYYILTDSRFFYEDKNQVEKLFEVTPKLFADTYEPFWKIPHDDTFYKFHFQYEFHPESLPKFSSDLSITSYHGCTTTYNCLELAVYMGFKEIYLLGVDASYSSKNESNKNDHFSKEYLSTSRTYHLPSYQKQMMFAYQAARQYADSHGIKIFNATRGGKLEIFPRVDFDLLFKTND